MIRITLNWEKAFFCKKVQFDKEDLYRKNKSGYKGILGFQFFKIISLKHKSIKNKKTKVDIKVSWVPNFLN